VVGEEFVAVAAKAPAGTEQRDPGGEAVGQGHSPPLGIHLIQSGIARLLEYWPGPTLQPVEIDAYNAETAAKAPAGTEQRDPGGEAVGQGHSPPLGPEGFGPRPGRPSCAGRCAVCA
jgi:hypothetical protein